MPIDFCSARWEITWYCYVIWQRWMLCVMLKLVFAVIELVYSHSCKMTLWWSVFQLTMPSTMCLGGGSVEVGYLERRHSCYS